MPFLENFFIQIKNIEILDEFEKIFFILKLKNVKILVIF